MAPLLLVTNSSPPSGGAQKKMATNLEIPQIHPTLNGHNLKPRALQSASKTALKQAFQGLSEMLLCLSGLIPSKTGSGTKKFNFAIAEITRNRTLFSDLAK